MTDTIERQADALLLAIVECSGGDLRRAFAILCARVTLEDVVGETFEQALGRAVGAYFRRPALALTPALSEPERHSEAAAIVGRPANDRGGRND